MEPGLHGARVSKKNSNAKFFGRKILKNIHGVDSVHIHHCDFFQRKIRIILAYTKKINLQKFEVLKPVYYSLSQLCDFVFFA